MSIGDTAIISLGIDAELEHSLERIARSTHTSKSELVRQGLRKLVETHIHAQDAWATGQELFGRYASGKTNLAENAEQILKDTFGEKKAQNRG